MASASSTSRLHMKTLPKQGENSRSASSSTKTGFSDMFTGQVKETFWAFEMRKKYRLIKSYRFYYIMSSKYIREQLWHKYIEYIQLNMISRREL